MAEWRNLCVVESVKGWSWEWDEKEGILARAGEGIGIRRNTKYTKSNQEEIQNTWNPTKARYVFLNLNLVRQPAAVGFLSFGTAVTPFTPTDWERWLFRYFFGKASKATLSILVEDENMSLPSLEPTRTPSWHWNINNLTADANVTASKILGFS